MLGELSPGLTISEEAILDMNIYLKHVFENLVERCTILLIERSEVCMTDRDIEIAVLHVVEGELRKYCIAEGRRAVKKWNEEG
ncbi:unnamed protein product [Larinioides sclopetarius]|uniref:Uncharacterized protein n=1 Tax=Larinioides sclopetarius TaxID=280406 RepID=A0AAV2AAI3_9ARAC